MAILYHRMSQNPGYWDSRVRTPAVQDNEMLRDVGGHKPKDLKG